MAEWRHIIEGPRWARFPSYLKDECWERGLKLSLDVDKGFIRETVRFEVSGSQDAVDSFRKHILVAVNLWNHKTTGR